ncbi:MAG: hypothetical protein HOE45_03455 [Gammaproteobacteria bacterium]|nr:hypothetical protein [Gammaproteobacteria bacterium]MBT4145930.1 hypothetical protein [Gammaproteobacteria bacterium]MBT5221441.1 hypothetical protein [Gammaproteobacteria bacterium]MBT5825135.1 hypothetical protein [Gammaproteobacteria bacterium]MBT5966899.1 hypothetical protein [Gammaproteobacteria bacterium]
MEIRIAYFPPYTSTMKPNKTSIFPHITRSLQGVVLKIHRSQKS